MKTIGPAIKKFRISRGLTQEQLASLLGYSHKSVITHIEKGESEMSYEKIALLLETFDISADELFRMNEDNNLQLPKRIETKRLVLRTFEEKDYDDLYEFLTQLKNDEFEPYPEITYKNCKKHFKSRLFSNEFYAIELKENSKVIGNIFLGNGKNRSKEVGYIINKDYQRRGYALEALNCIVDKALEVGVHRIYALCDPRNDASWMLLEKAGFTKEGVLKKNVYFKKDRNGNPIWKDTAVYSIVKGTNPNRENKKLGFLGLGKMGTSILKGVMNNHLYKRENILFYAPSFETQEKGKFLGANLAKDERELVEKSNIVVLAIKPQKYDEVFSKFDGINFKNKIIVSLAPGKSINYLKVFFKDAQIVRAMPNTPSFVNKGVTTLKFDKDINKEVTDIFSSIGSYVILDSEEKIDETIPLNGSMPAYMFEFINAFIESALEYGITREDAKKLALETISGCCELAKKSDDDFDTLINNVCSKGGSTIEGLNVLRNSRFKGIIKECYKACVNRSKELGGS